MFVGQGFGQTIRMAPVANLCFVGFAGFALRFTERSVRAENFRHGSRVLASLLIAAEVQLHTGFTPSRSNPSDPPSRGVHKIDKPCSTKVLHKSHSHTLTDHPHFLKRCHRNIIKRGVNMPSWSLGSWASSCSSGCLAQPSSIGY